MKPNSSVPPRPLSVAANRPIRTYAELQERIRNSLRAQHPEWVKPNGESPLCDLYERRLAELIAIFQSREANVVSTWEDMWIVRFARQSHWWLDEAKRAAVEDDDPFTGSLMLAQRGNVAEHHGETMA